MRELANNMEEEIYIPVEPTIPVTHPYGVNLIAPPPPPWPPDKKRRRHIPRSVYVFVMFSVFCIIVGVAGGVYYTLFYTASKQHKTSLVVTPVLSLATVAPTTTPTQQVTAQPTVDPNYTATDILGDFKLTGKHFPYTSYGSTIWSWSGDVFSVSVNATSSVQWTDDSGCTGYCSPANLGLWVYSSASVAQTAFNDVGNDETNKQLTPAPGPSIVGPNTPEYLHGRCLLLGASLPSTYAQVVQHDCV